MSPQHLLPIEVAIARCLGAVVGRAVALDAKQEPVAVAGISDTDVHPVVARSHLLVNR